MADEIQKAVGDYLLSRINATHDAIMTDANPDYLPRDPDPSVLCHRDLVERVNEAIRVCRDYNHSGFNVSAHALAAKILKILEGEQ